MEREFSNPSLREFRVKTMRIFLVAGTRPQIIKSVPVIQEANRRGVELQIVHTGQHYDYNMSDVFFENFSIPEPIVNLGVGSGTQGYQTGEIIIRLEKFLIEEQPDLVVVPGDTNSALASAIATVKLGIPLAHIEAGARSYNMAMQEEINRRVIDHISTLLFTVSRNCKENLLREHVLGKMIVSGDTMYDIYEHSLPTIGDSDILDRLKLVPKEYSILTLHREENVDNAGRLTTIMRAITSLNTKVVFPIHPRTKKRLQHLSLNSHNLVITNPLDYFSMMKLVRESLLVLTDSGGLQKEAFWSKVPCITLRDETEWVETVKEGVNVLVGADKNKILDVVNSVIRDYNTMISNFKAANLTRLYCVARKAIIKSILEHLKKISLDNNC